MNKKYTYTVFNNDLKPVSSVVARNAIEAIEIARKPWLLNPIVENTTLMLKANPNHKPTTGLEFIEERPIKSKEAARRAWIH